MYVFVPIYKQKLYILKIELFLGINTILWNKKSALKCFKCYSEKRLHNFGNRLEKSENRYNNHISMIKNCKQ